MNETAWLRIIELQSDTLCAAVSMLKQSELRRVEFAKYVNAHLVVLRGELKVYLRCLTMNFNELEAAVAENESVDQSAITLLNGLSQMIKDAGVDPQKLAAISGRLTSSSAALAAAVTANTHVTA